MKLVLFAAALLIGTTGYLLWRAHGLPVVNLPFAVAHRSGSTPPQIPSPEPKPRPRRPSPEVRPDADKPVEQIAEQPIAAHEPSTAAPARPTVRLPFPLPAEVAQGQGEESVTGKYGNPSAWVVSSNEGHVIETLVYTRERGGSSTVIRCVDGIVADVYAKALPPSPPGSLVRDFERQD